MAEALVRSFVDVEPWLAAHERLKSVDGVRILAEFHARIDDADERFWRLVHVERPLENSRFSTLELTEFGRIVGGDSPRWWVLAEESDVAELWNDTKVTFLSTQSLLRSAEKFVRRNFHNYDELIDGICTFVSTQQHHIEALSEFAERLSNKNDLAPAILYSYSVWWSTRRSDRSLSGAERTSDDSRLQVAGEIVLGLRTRSWPTLYQAWLESLDDRYETATCDEDLQVTPEELYQRVDFRVKRSLVEYFTQVRDSLRHIDMVSQEAGRREQIYADDEFLQRLLAKISADTIVETDLWDVKETLAMWACQPQHGETAAITLVEDVAAFANTRGGILIVGVTDRTREIVGVSDIENRIKHIEETVRSRADCPAQFLRVRAVRVDDKTCIVVVVGQTTMPVGVRQTNGSYSYPIRVGPGIERVSRSEVSATKSVHMKGTSFAFAGELAAWLGI